MKDKEMLKEFKEALEMFRGTEGTIVVDLDLLFKDYPLVYEWFSKRDLKKRVDTLEKCVETLEESVDTIQKKLLEDKIKNHKYNIGDYIACKVLGEEGEIRKTGYIISVEPDCMLKEYVYTIELDTTFHVRYVRLCEDKIIGYVFAKDGEKIYETKY